MPKPFAHGTVRSWKRGNVMKHGAAWTKLARERIAPVQPVAAVAPTSFGGDPYAGAAPFTPEMSGTLGAIVSKLGEEGEMPIGEAGAYRPHFGDPGPRGLRKGERDYFEASLKQERLSSLIRKLVNSGDDDKARTEALALCAEITAILK